METAISEAALSSGSTASPGPLPGFSGNGEEALEMGMGPVIAQGVGISWVQPLLVTLGCRAGEAPPGPDARKVPSAAALFLHGES